MKTLLYCSVICFLTSCAPSKKELFEITDSFVESLQTTYDSYGMLGGKEHEKVTSDGKYRVMPVGRLINVKILEPVDDEVYKELEEELEKHYEGDERVNDVYINKGGTIMIDCRN